MNVFLFKRIESSSGPILMHTPENITRFMSIPTHGPMDMNVIGRASALGNAIRQ